MRVRVYLCTCVSVMFERDIPCDVNCDNPLGLRNTKLLTAYGNIDERFRILG